MIFCSPTVVNEKKIHQPGLYMTLPLTLLSILSIISGIIISEIFAGINSDFFSDSIYILQ